MTEYDNTNKGAIWPNDEMRPDKQDPHFRGSINVEGVEYWVNAWKRKPDAKAGSPSLSFSINRKDANKAPNPQRSRPSDAQDQDGMPPHSRSKADDFDDDIPF